LPLNVSGPLLFVGIDWAAQIHAVCVLDVAGRQIAVFTVEHTDDGLAGLTARLARLGDPEQIPVAIERPDGRLVDVLLAAGHPVVPVKPNAIKAWRDGEVLSGAKSDVGDAQIIAEYLRLRHHRLHLATPYSSQTRALRTVVRTRDDLVDMRIAATNQLSALLDAHWPGAKAIFADVASPIALEFLTRYPTARHAARLGAKRIAAFCAQHGYSGRRCGEQLLARLRAAPAGTLDDTLCQAVRDAVIALVAVVKAIAIALKDIGRSVVTHLGEHPDGEIFTSLPRSGQINAAQMLAEWGDCRPAYDSPDAIAALAGATPGHQGIRQAPGRALPLGLQQTLPQGDHHIRRQQPPRKPLGRKGLRRSTRPRPRPPPRRTRPGPSLDPGNLALLDRSNTIRSRPPRQRRTTAQVRAGRTACRLRLT